MIASLVIALIMSPSAGPVLGPVLGPVAAQAIAPGDWTITSTLVDLSAPGVPGFMVRMMRGKSKVEHKRLSAAQGVEALLAPDPTANCRVDTQRVADGQYAQAITCPQKKGDPLHIARVGTYDGAGFAGRATVTGTTPKGRLTMELNQRAARSGD